MTSNRLIDYSMLPETVSKPMGPLKSLWWAVCIIVGVAAVLGLGALLTNNGNRETVMATLASIGLVLFIGALIRAFMIMFKKLGSQKRQMSEFAAVNHYEYDGKRVFLKSDELPSELAIYAKRAYCRFRVTGTGQNGTFEYYQFIISKYGGILTSGYARMAHVGIIRQPSSDRFESRQLDTYIYESANAGYKYTLYDGNALTRSSLRQLFQHAGVDSNRIDN